MRPRLLHPGVWFSSAQATLPVALLLLMFANGRFAIALFAWLGPLLLLRFTRGGGFQRLALAFLGLGLSFGFQFYGMTPLDGVGYYILALGFAVILLLPYLADRYLATRLEGLPRTLVFPLALVVSEFLTSFGPFGSWGSVAYTQYEHLPLLQIVSVTGLHGITFLVGWFAAAGNAWWEADFVFRGVRRESAAFALTFAVALAGGEARLVFFPPSSQTLRVASITRPELPPIAPDLNSRLMRGGPLTSEEIGLLRQRNTTAADFLLDRTDLEAEAGARLVTFGEFNLPVLSQDEPGLLVRALDLARRRRIYIGLPLAEFDLGHRPPALDKLLMIEPSGQIAWEYRKTKMPPGEGEVLGPGSGRLPVVETPWGRLGGAIAFDMDFPGFMRQVGHQHTDLLVVPENEYPQIDPMHSRMALFRAIENGSNLLLHASQSLSLACDYQGRIYGLMDHYHTNDRVLVTQVPTHGVITLYSRGGYLFPWVCLAGLLVLLVVADGPIRSATAVSTRDRSYTDNIESALKPLLFLKKRRPDDAQSGS